MTPPQPGQDYETTAGDGGRLLVGCAMWAHKAWPGQYFPADTRQGGELVPYATWCTAVEGNTTFYATPPATTISRWRDDTPDGFEFCFKLPRTITHERRLRNAAELTAQFCDRIAPMAERLGPIQIQLPPSFSGSDLPALADFLARAPSIEGFSGWAVELRHPDFFVGGPKERAVDDLLIEHAANRVILDSRALFDLPAATPDEIDAWQKKPRLPVRPVATADRPIIRLIGNRDPEASLRRWEQWVPTLVRWLGEKRTPTVFTHTPDNHHALPLARRFHEMVVRACLEQDIGCEPLPEPSSAEIQLGLELAHRTASTIDSRSVAADANRTG